MKMTRPLPHAPGLTFLRLTWLLITLGAVVFYIVSAWAFYQVLVTNPFFGSTVQPGALDLAAVELGLQKWGLSLAAYAAINVASQTLITSTCCLLGALIFWRRSSERAIWTMSLLLVLLGTLVASQALAIAQLYPAFGLVAFVVNQVSTAILLALFWLFPTGRFVPAWSRWLLLMTVLVNFLGSILALPDLAAVLLFAEFILFGSALLAQVYRYRRVSGQIERQQTKWVILALLVGPFLWATGAFLLPTLFPSLTQSSENAAPYNLVRWTFNNLATFLIPLAIGLSVLRYRLWDIDIIIRRTLTYALVTALLVIIFFGSVILLQQIFSGITGSGQNEIVTVLSTLAIAALFVPLHNRIQIEIDKRFNRNKYNAQQILNDFANTLRDDTDLEKLTGRLMQVVDETMQPRSVSLWLKKTGEPPRRTK